MPQSGLSCLEETNQRPRKAQERTESKDVIGEGGGAGVVLLDPQIGPHLAVGCAPPGDRLHRVLLELQALALSDDCRSDLPNNIVRFGPKRRNSAARGLGI